MRDREIIGNEIQGTITLNLFVKHSKLKALNVVRHHQLGLMIYMTRPGKTPEDLVS